MLKAVLMQNSCFTGGLDNALAETQNYIDNVKLATGKFEYAGLRQPLTYLDLSRNVAGLNYAGELFVE